MKTIAFGASSSRNSINKQFATFFANHIDSNAEILDLNDYPLPIYSVDLEQTDGIPKEAEKFLGKLNSADLIIISLAEHNGSYTAVFKNLFDWVSRIEGKAFANKKVFLLATSPGGRGGAGVLQAATDRFPRHGAEIVGTFSLPSFQTNFDAEKGITDAKLWADLNTEMEKVKAYFS